MSEVEKAFGDIDVVTVDGIDGEFGFVTSLMTEKAFKTAASNVEVINRIRIDKTRI